MKRKLIEVDVLEIRRRFASGESVSKLATEFERTTNGIRNIATGKSWPNIAMPNVDSSALATCRVCEAKLHFITPTHLAKHDLTVEQYHEKYPDAKLTGTADRKRRAENARVQNAANFADGGNAKVKAKMSQKAKVRAKKNADANTEAWRSFQAASRPFTAKTWEDPEWREKMAKVSRANMKKILKKMWTDPKHRKRHTKRMKSQWADPVWGSKQRKIVRENARKALYAHLKKQGINKMEQRVFDLIEPLDFEYTGDGTFWIRKGDVSMNPDFVRKSDKTIVEFFGDYWHQGETGDVRVQHFAQLGWQTVIVWQSEFLRDPTVVVDRLLLLPDRKID